MTIIYRIEALVVISERYQKYYSFLLYNKADGDYLSNWSFSGNFRVLSKILVVKIYRANFTPLALIGQSHLRA